MHAIKDKTTSNGGLFLPGVSSKIVKSDGSPAQAGEEGELHVQSLSGALGYLDDENACVPLTSNDQSTSGSG